MTESENKGNSDIRPQQADGSIGKREWVTPEVRKYDIKKEISGPDTLLGGDVIILGGS